MKKILILFPPREKASSAYYFRADQELMILSKQYAVNVISPISITDYQLEKSALVIRVFRLFFLLPKILTEIALCDVVIIYTSISWFLFAPIAKIFGKKLVLDHFTTSIYNYEVTDNKLKYLFKYIDPYLYKLFDLVITHTQNMKNLIVQYYAISKNKVFVTYSCVDSELFTKNNTQPIPNISKKLKNKIVIMYHGYFHPYHGVDIILKAAKKIKNKNVIFFILGQKLPYTAKNVVSISFVKYIDLPKYLSLADIWVGSLGKGIQGERALSSNMIAAMAMSLPVVVGNCPEIKKFIRDGSNGYIIQRSNADALVNKLENILIDYKKNKKIVDKIGLNARDTVLKNFSLPILEKNLLRIIGKVCK